MNATAKKGIWQERHSDVTINYDTTRFPQRITIQKMGENPVHLEYADGIGEKEIKRARALAQESFKIAIDS